jgi:hypothetical protein
VAWQPAHVRVQARDRRCGPSHSPGARRLAHLEHGPTVRSPGAGGARGGGRTDHPSRRQAFGPAAGLRAATSAELRLCREQPGGWGSRCIVTSGLFGHGGLASTGKAVDLKSTGPRGPWEFESPALRQQIRCLKLHRAGSKHCRWLQEGGNRPERGRWSLGAPSQRNEVLRALRRRPDLS